MNMTFENKQQLCDCVNEVMKFTDVSLEQLIGKAKSLKEAEENINKAFVNLACKHLGTAIETNLGLIAQSYTLDDCVGCKLPVKYCRCPKVYNCELIEGSYRGRY